MKKLKEFWASLDEETIISKRELFLGLLSCVLAGIVTGIFFSPRKNVTIGSNNGKGDYRDCNPLTDCEEEEE